MYNESSNMEYQKRNVAVAWNVRVECKCKSTRMICNKKGMMVKRARRSS
jgi:hypothetical protein